ncbi:hypothetical protein MSNKSG1_03146 [Marinobacter santoriniensis NKSG1]|uniref:PEP-CTERM sorting domain-containing protein n=1 Tax=Marinobacter santoriniensis NKSG1 TaxID=1288826 RepID=M7DH82_9GAMM|nr:hypothetical protein [Marinobacter santoriniensis]EMP57022.1 hypothetical protein MSNKSG1_03146 [Marinobacter santoriniensis NKSG1]
MGVSQSFFSKQRQLQACLVGVGVCAVSMTSVAAPITPQFDRFGELSEATFGGSGIPNDSVAITEFDVFGSIETLNRPRSLGTITLGMSSHGRYDNVDEGNDGNGTFFASTGSNIPPSSSLEGATWNFNFFASFTANDFISESYIAEELSAIELALFYDFDSAVGTDEADHGVINFGALSPASLPLQGSQNLLFSYLGDSSLPGITAPAFSFDPSAAGEYTLALTASKSLK